MICKIDGCENKVHARGWCSKHYQRWQHHGDPNFTKYECNGYGHSSVYNMWISMKSRCYSENCKEYKWYGGRGIIVCDEWMSPKIFVEWCLNNGWKKGLEIDRINNNGNYESNNCRFVIHKENIHNQRLLTVRNTSGYRGVSYFKKDNNWIARINVNNKSKHLGYFNTLEKAAIAYDNAVSDNRPKNFTN